MRGKKPKERERYSLRMPDGTQVEVTREIYLEWYQSRRRQRYQQERDRKHSLCSLDAFVYEQRNTTLDQDMADRLIQEECVNKLQKQLSGLTQAELWLVQKLYFENCAMTEIAKQCGCTARTIQNRRNRILVKLRKKLLEAGMDFEDLNFF